MKWKYNFLIRMYKKMSYLNTLPCELFIKCILDYFLPAEIVKNKEVTTIFSNEVWKTVWKRDISTFNIPENITYELYIDTYSKYSRIGVIEFEKITYIIEHNYNKLVDLVVANSEQYKFNIDHMIFHLGESNNIKFIEYVIGKMQQFKQYHLLHFGRDEFKYYDRLLQGAAMAGNKYVIKWLITNPDIDSLDYNGGLTFAARGRHKDIMQWMIDLGATDYGGALAEACGTRDNDIFKWMLDLTSKYTDLDEKIEAYNSAMRESALVDDIEKVKLFLDLGATDYDLILQEPGVDNEDIWKLVLSHKNGTNIE